MKQSDLDLIEPGHIYIKRLYTPVIYSNFIRSYFLRENNIINSFKSDGFIKHCPFNIETYKSSNYTLDLENMYKDDEDELPSFLKKRFVTENLFEDEKKEEPEDDLVEIDFEYIKAEINKKYGNE